MGEGDILSGVTTKTAASFNDSNVLGSIQNIRPSAMLVHEQKRERLSGKFSAISKLSLVIDPFLSYQ